MCTQEQLDNITTEVVKIYQNVYGDDISDIILYGSYARGDSKDDSDIDVVAIVKGAREDLQKRLRIVWELTVDIGLENDVIVSPMVIPYDEFETYKRILPYYRSIAEEGRRIG